VYRLHENAQILVFGHESVVGYTQRISFFQDIIIITTTGDLQLVLGGCLAGGQIIFFQNCTHQFSESFTFLDENIVFQYKVQFFFTQRIQTYVFKQRLIIMT
jgi:hypothetical protein